MRAGRWGGINTCSRCIDAGITQACKFKRKQHVHVADELHVLGQHLTGCFHTSHTFPHTFCPHQVQARPSLLQHELVATHKVQLHHAWLQAHGGAAVWKPVAWRPVARQECEGHGDVRGRYSLLRAAQGSRGVREWAQRAVARVQRMRGCMRGYSLLRAFP